jgi:HK97 family phage prohead protease
MKVERRDLCGDGVKVETREDGKRFVTGYASVFFNAKKRSETEYKLWEGMVERVAPTAFNRALKEKHDVRGLFNHDSNQVLGRSTAGTLKLSVDERGLKYEIDLPDTQLGKDLAVSIERGDINGSSFAFYVTGRTIEETDNLTIRTITDVTLQDVGPVTFPAYTGTTTNVRSVDKDSIEIELRAHQQFEFTRLHRLHALEMLDK